MATFIIFTRENDFYLKDEEIIIFPGFSETSLNLGKHLHVEIENSLLNINSSEYHYIFSVEHSKLTLIEFEKK